MIPRRKARRPQDDEVAPCSACGSRPLAAEHLARAGENRVCAQRVADVVLMHRLVDELRRPVPPPCSPPCPGYLFTWLEAAFRLRAAQDRAAA